MRPPSMPSLCYRPYLILVIILFYCFDCLATKEVRHKVRHHHGRPKRQESDLHPHHSHVGGSYTPGTYVVSGDTEERGPWGPWSEPSDCSRSCGGGVAFQTRQCRDRRPEGSHSCTGPPKRYFSCNIQDCPEGAQDFRAAQCTEFNEQAFEGRFYEWLPYTKAPNKCELNCMPKGERFYYRHKKKVIDGTRCDEESHDICVDGKCLPVGCDMILGSNTEEDKCRECGGDGSNCNTVQGSLDIENLQVGYNDVLLIPAGATNILVKERTASNNYLAVRNLTGYYFLNGNWRIDFPRELKFANSIFHYERKPHGFFAPETIRALGPTNESIYIVVLFQEASTGIDYEYSLPKGAVQSETDSYSWVMGAYGECNAPCGGGSRYRDVRCMKASTFQEASEDLCDPYQRPPSEESCNTDPCQPRWFIGDWNACSATCGEGTQFRYVYCEQVISGAHPSVVQDEKCLETVGPKPEAVQKCGEEQICPSWFVGHWSPCDHLCGDGVQRRRVVCHMKIENRVEILHDGSCPSPKPENSKPCFVQPCEGVDWVTTAWTGCDKCGQTNESRQVLCSTQKGEIYPDESCHEYRRPPAVQDCKDFQPCQYAWYATQWSECSSRCGAGVKSRLVFCGESSGGSIKTVDDDKCDAEKKYESEEECVGTEECGGEWYAGPWSKCSKNCGGGIMTRKILCFVEDKVVDVKNCMADSIPFSQESCNGHPCGPDEIMPMEPEEVVDEEEECIDEEEYISTTDSILGSGDGLNATDFTEFGSGDTEPTEGTENVTVLTSTEFDTNMTELTTSSLDLNVTELSSLSTIESNFTSMTANVSELSTTNFTELTANVSDIFSTEEGNLTTESTADLNMTTIELNITEISTVESNETDISSTEFTTLDLNVTTEESNETEISSTEFTTLDLNVTTEESNETEISSTEFTTLDLNVTTEESNATDLSSDTSITVDANATTEELNATTWESTTEDLNVTTDGLNVTDLSTLGLNVTVADFNMTSEDLNITTDDFNMTEPTTLDMNITTEDFNMTELTTLDLNATSEDLNMTESTTVDLNMTESTPVDLNMTESTTVDLNMTESTTVDLNMTELTSIDLNVTTDQMNATELSTAETSSVDANATTEELNATELSSIADLNATSVEYTTLGSNVTEEESNATDLSTHEVTLDSNMTTSELNATEVSMTETDLNATELSTLEANATELTANVTELTSEGLNVTELTSESLNITELTSEMLNITELNVTDVTTEGLNMTELTTLEFNMTTLDLNVTELDSNATEYSARTPFEMAVTQEQRVHTCKPRKKKEPSLHCEETQFGCCPDGVTEVKGPFLQGCPQPKTCNDTEFGCCPDMVSVAEGTNEEGCPVYPCEETLFGCCPDGIYASQGNEFEGCKLPCNMTDFGCCPDNVTEAQGPNEEGCEPEGTTTLSPSEECQMSSYGCCPVGDKPAEGPNYQGCPEIMPDNCTASYFGCCPDGFTAALGIRNEGCAKPCGETAHGCCEDGLTPAHGPNREGCCLNTEFGCCPDNTVPAQGTHLEGCGCQYSPHGCCPDNQTAARGPSNEGCGCRFTTHGCCQDDYTPAGGPDFSGCACHTFRFGCCPDGFSVARGPYQEGCGCEYSEHGCCPDRRTPAQGPGGQGCGCESSRFGCCPDGVFEAQGDDFEGCTDSPKEAGRMCSLDRDRGSCRNFSVKWFFDMEYGGCSRFWYGGCEGNDNRFGSQEECKAVCVEPPGREACYLPKVAGPCEGYYPSWYYDTERKSCNQFIYGGCLGNSNRFTTREDCETRCTEKSTVDVCEQPKTEGPCHGNFTRWYYDSEEDWCKEFTYGGCKGNRNNFLAERECHQRCRHQGRAKGLEVPGLDICALPKSSGPCRASFARWYFDQSHGTCRQFVYGGCEGNLNQFLNKEQCQEKCPDKKPTYKEICLLPRMEGPCHETLPRWYFDGSERRCMPFYYGGCEGNSNNFEAVDACERLCPPAFVLDKTCHQAPVIGECDQYTERWYFDAYEGQCKSFVYGGCGGNTNNFISLQECQATCSALHTTVAPPDQDFRLEYCFLPAQEGSCTNSRVLWSYDSRDGVCKQFYYSGCEGNQNRFETQLECESRCEGSQDVCILPRVVGPCSGSFQQWFYDAGTDACHPFDYGGCLGNRNRFDTREACEGRCRRYVEPVISTPAAPYVDDICALPYDVGPCREGRPAFFFDVQYRQCRAFTYGGCGGNANRYESVEQCERQCGEFKGQDVCNMPDDHGPCGETHVKFFYDPVARTCVEFEYGGCGGNGNRFSSIQECESICLQKTEILPSGNDTELSNAAICRLPVDTGPCRDGHKRWYFDIERSTCIPFIYGGCAGNFNRFKTFDICLHFCHAALQESRHQPRPPLPDESPRVDENEIQPQRGSCAEARHYCALLQCAHGLEKWVDENDCEQCRCREPCRDHECPEGSRCSVDLYQAEDGTGTQVRAVCRRVNKPGSCPSLSHPRAGTTCEQECQSDSDCPADLKCCFNGCGSSCIIPVVDRRDDSASAHRPEPPSQETPHYPDERGEEPTIDGPPDEEVRAEEGSITEMNCDAHGAPLPSVSWRGEDGEEVGRGEGRFRLLDDGSLQVIGVARQDAGEYTCVADNGVGRPAYKRATLIVTDPSPRQAEIIGEHQFVVASLGSPASIRCYVIGWPRPSVTWWRGQRMLPLSSERYEQRRDFSLLIRSVGLRDLGLYTCQAYNGLGRAASWTLTLQAVGPVYGVSPEEQEFTVFLVDRARGPQQTPTLPPRVVRPRTKRPVLPPAPPTLPPQPVEPAVAGVHASIPLERSSFPTWSDVRIPCEVEGHPPPSVRWFKDGQEVRETHGVRIHPSDHSLLILKANASDGGNYRCEATNQYGSADSQTVTVYINGVYVHPNCTDNPFFANCQLIVKAKYCTNKYYAKFCCQSCTLAGQLPSHGPHLDYSASSSDDDRNSGADTYRARRG